MNETKETENIFTKTELAQFYAKLAQVCIGELAQTRAELAQARAELAKALADLAQAKQLHAHVCAYCGYQYPLGSMLTEHIESCPKHPLAKALADLAQAHDELTEVRARWLNPVGAAEYRRQLANVTANREFWYKEAQDAESERDKIRLEAKGLRRQLAKAEAHIAAVGQAVEGLWGFWDGNSLVAIKGFDADIAETWDKLLKAVDTPIAAQLLDRLATLDAAEAALAGCGIGGIFAEFDGLADAINQMAQHIKELGSRLTQAQADLAAELIEIEITGKEMVQALQAERQLRHETEHELVMAEDTLKVVSQRAEDTEVELERGHRTLTHLGVPPGDENGKLPITRRIEQMLRTGCQLRREAEQRRTDARLAQHKLELKAGLERQSAYTERALRQEAEQRAERAEALAALVNEEMAELLDRLGISWKVTLDNKIDARNLAAKIRKMLNDNQA